MGEATEDLRRDIEDTRSAMSGTLEAIGDRVSPGRIMERRRNRAVVWVRDTRYRVMGRADELTSRMGDGAHQAGQAPQAVAETMRERTQGSPLVAGGIAFGVGMLVGSMFPASQTERRLGEQAMRATEPIKGELQDAGRQVAENLKEPVREAVEDVKQTAQESAQQVKGSAQSSAAQVREDAKR
jgi:ElaB/YqjD/DUF883 family membrane-anchored ribosome-binding protein